ncbi:MAG: hypothetical protein ABIG10_03875 [bacterium]
MDDQQAQQFLKKLGQLSDEVQFYFNDEISGSSISEIAELYGFEKDLIYDLVYDLVINNFDINLLKQNIVKLVNNDREISKDLTLDILGKILLPIDQYLDINIEQLIIDNNGNIENYNSYVMSFKNRLDGHILDLLNDYVDEQIEAIDPDQEKIAVDILFNNHILDVLRDENPETLAILNSGLLYLLNNEEGLQKKLEQMLLDNQVKITSQEITINDKKFEPTAGNWIRSFINSAGLDKYDIMAVSDYLIKSGDVNVLSEKERSIVNRLITIYLNIKFYPESIADKPLTELHIIPLPAGKENKFKKVVKPQPAIIKSPEQISSSILKLQKMAENYSQGSLERLVIEEEIKKQQAK